MQGIYKVKDEKLKKLHLYTKKVSENFEIVSFKHIKRNENSEADALVNQAIDEYLRKKEA